MITIQTIKISLLITTLFAIISCGKGEPQSNTLQKDLQKTEVEILSLLTISDSTEQYSLTFGSKTDTSLKLSMLVGKYEAQTLAITLEELKPTAPLPLDLLQDAIKKFGYNVVEVFIDSLTNEIYMAKVICTSNNKKIELKARPVDGATMCPIYVDSKFLNQ